MKIRPVHENDSLAIAELTNGFIRHTAIHFGLEPISVEDVRHALHATGDRYPWLVAEIGGSFAGFAKAGAWRTRDAYAHTCETSVYVHRDFQGRGVGRSLMAALLDELRERGFHLAVAGMTLPNEGSARLHESLGFEFVGTFRECGRKFDAWHDVAFYQLRL